MSQHGGLLGGSVQFCRTHIRKGNALVGRCKGCGEKLYLCLPYGWVNEFGGEHRCSA